MGATYKCKCQIFRCQFYYIFYIICIIIRPFPSGKGLKWASKKLPKSIPEALKNDSATVILKEQSD